MNKKFSLRSRLMIYMTIIYVAVFLFIILRINKMAVSDAKEITDSYAMKYSEILQSKLNSYMDVSRTIGLTFDSYQSIPSDLRRTTFSTFMQNILSKNDDFLSIWTIWEPKTIDNLDSLYKDKPGSTMQGNFATNYYKKNGQILLQDNNSLTSTSLFQGENYALPKKRKLETILNPYLNSYSDDKKDNSQITSLVYPILKDGNFLGVVSIDVNISVIQKIIDQIKPFDESYAFIVNNEGNIIINQANKLEGKPVSGLFADAEIKSELPQKISNGEYFPFMARDNESKKSVYCSFAPLKIGKSSQNWSLGIIVPKEAITSKTSGFFYFCIFLGIVGLILLIFAAWKISDDITKPLLVTTEVLKNIAQGDIDVEKLNEIGTQDVVHDITNSVNLLIEGLNKTTQFAREIGKGNLDVNFELLGSKDILGKSLIDMRESLQKAQLHEKQRKIEDDKRSWASNGIAKFSEILRKNNDNLNELSYDLISNLVDYLGANQGGLFSLNDEDENDVFIELSACCAFDRRKYHQHRIEMGDGLVGMCVQEGQTVYMTDIPDNYIEITSGMGDSNPKSLLIVPLKLNDKTYGVIEIASFKEFDQYQIEFVEKLGENIASTISNVKINVSTSSLLEKFQQQAEEMKAQEEELRQNLEELQSTQEEMDRIKQDEIKKTKDLMHTIEENQKLLVDILDKIPGTISLKDENGVYLIVNTPLAKLFNKTVSEIIGHTDFDIHPYESAKSFRDSDLEVMQKGENTSIQEISKNGETTYFRFTKMPFYNRTTGQTGLLSITYDISDVKNLENQLVKQNKELKETQELFVKEKYLMDTLMDTIPNSIYFKDKESKFLRVSKYMYEKHNGKDLIGKSDFDFFSIEHAQQAFDDEQRIINTNQPVIDLVEKETFDDGKIEWVSTTKMPLKDNNGEIIGTFGISRSVTDLKKSELDGIQQKEILELVLANLDVVRYSVDNKGIITKFKGEGLKKMGETEENIVGKNIFEYFAHAADEIKKCQVEAIPIVFTVKGEHDKKKWTFEHHVFRHKYIDGALVGFAFER
jgi:methyl-accepting chemotaxis protein